MSSEVLIKGFFVSIMSLMFGWVVFSRYDTEIGSECHSDSEPEGHGQRYTPGISGALLPLFILTLAILALIYYDLQTAAQMTLSMCFGIFLHISIYYVILMGALPFLRKHISARACAMLWMIPNYLYLTQQSYMTLPKPLLVIRAPEKLVWIIFGVWLAGFGAVLLWKMISHLLFRAHILHDAAAVDELQILAVWNEEIERAQISKPKFKLVTSPHVTTPLSIGLFRRTTRVVLPQRFYSTDELSLIFRHEMIHICREEAWAKFFLVFCTAMCWFNPLMWIAMRKSADDLELSCDETVLLEADENTRRQYANLILNTASDERGFTTCLSASASALRYRLKNIVKPRTRHSGGLIVALTFFVLCMSCGYVALAYGSQTGAEVIYQSRDTGLYTLRYIAKSDDDSYTVYECTDPDALHEYLISLTLCNLTGNYSFDDSETQFTFLYDTPEGTLGIVLSDQTIKLTQLYGEDPSSTCYYLPDDVDWNYLNSILCLK